MAIKSIKALKLSGMKGVKFPKIGGVKTATLKGGPKGKKGATVKKL